MALEIHREVQITFKFHQILYSWVTEISTPVRYDSTYVLHVQYMCTSRHVTPCPRLMALIRL